CYARVEGAVASAGENVGGELFVHFCSLIGCGLRPRLSDWMPACAGMTVGACLRRFPLFPRRRDPSLIGGGVRPRLLDWMPAVACPREGGDPVRMAVTAGMTGRKTPSAGIQSEYLLHYQSIQLSALANV